MGSRPRTGALPQSRRARSARAFLKLAEAYGIRGFRARDEEEFRAGLDAALSLRKPALLECLLDIDERVLPIVPSGKPIDELILEPSEE